MERVAEKCKGKATEEVKQETKAGDQAETDSFWYFETGRFCIKDNGSVFALPILTSSVSCNKLRFCL